MHFQSDKNTPPLGSLQTEQVHRETGEDMPAIQDIILLHMKPLTHTQMYLPGLHSTNEIGETDALEQVSSLVMYELQ